MTKGRFQLFHIKNRSLKSPTSMIFLVVEKDEGNIESVINAGTGRVFVCIRSH